MAKKAGSKKDWREASKPVLVSGHEHLTPFEWQTLMLNQVAYVKPTVKDGQPMFAVHAADGTELAILCDHDMAFKAVESHDLLPVSVH